MNMRGAASKTLRIGIVSLAASTSLRAQNASVRLINAALVQVRALECDSAITLARKAIELAPTDTERTSGLVVLGTAQLCKNQRLLAGDSFHQALLLDHDLRVDSLRGFVSDLVPVFEAARARLLVGSLRTPRDTIVPFPGLLQLTAQTSHRAGVVLSITSGGAIVWNDSQVVVGTRILEWNLRSSGGAAISPGDYVLQLSARDSLGESATPIERRMKIEALVADTQPLPPPLEPSAFAPESITVTTSRQPVLLVRGLVIGSAAAVLSSLGPSGGKGLDTKSYLVGGTIALGGVVGFLLKHRVTRALPMNIEQNRELLEQDEQRRADIVEANRRARGRPRLRIRIEASTQ